MQNDPKLLDQWVARRSPSGMFRSEEREGRRLLRGVPGGETRAGTVNAETFTSDAMVSTRDLDRYETILEPDGWELGNYAKNPVVFLNHDDRALPIGKSIAQEKKSNGLWARTLFAASAEGAPDEAREAWAMHRAGFMGAWSVSFWPELWESFQLEIEGRVVNGIRFLRLELLEYSLVGLPGNPNALTLGLARVALASAQRFGRAIPDSKLDGDLGLISRAARLAESCDDMVQEILQPSTEDKAFQARVAALKSDVQLLSPQQKSGRADEALAQALADLRAAGAVLKAL